MALADRQQAIYDSQNYQELADSYNQWAKDYDKDLVDDCRYVAPRQVVDIIARLLPPEARILDAGAGTGLVGELLYQNGYVHLEAIDIAAEMLALARGKNVYTRLSQQVMGEPLDLPTDTFDAIVSVGVFTYGHAPSGSFDELLRIVKPGGYILFTLRLDFYENSDFKQKLTALEASQQWQLVELSDPFSPLSTAQPGGYYRVWVYQAS